jgi:hypothetical protein
MFAYLFGMKRQDNAFRAIGDTAFLRRSLSHAKKNRAFASAFADAGSVFDVTL